MSSPPSPTLSANPDTHTNGMAEEDPLHALSDSTSALLPESHVDIPFRRIGATKSDTSAELQLSTKISSIGIGIGYLAAITVQILSVGIVQAFGGTTFSLRLVLFTVGIWWFVFTIPTGIWLNPRPSPPLHSSTSSTTSSSRQALFLAYLSHAWKSLWLTILRARRLRDVLLFLSAWFLLSDGIATISSTAILFAKTTLGMQPAALASINVVVMLFGVLGAFAWRHLARALSLSPAHTILACLLVFELIPLYALLGYVPFVRRWGVLGLQQPWEMFPLGAVYGLVLGGLSSYCRAFFGELVPRGSEAAFFALYAITDKGSSVLGPAVVGFITDRTGDIRPAFWFLAVLIGLPFPLLWAVDVERGRREGAVMADELNKTGAGGRE